MHPEAYSLSAVKWDLFVTLTLPSRLLEAGDARLGCVLFAWLRRVGEVQKVHFRRLLWVLRSEHGEATGRLHFHCLLGGLEKLTKRSRFQIKNTWEQITGAHSRVTRYKDDLPGVGYVLKGGAAYEFSKFSRSADVVTLAKAVAGRVARSNAVLLAD